MGNPISKWFYKQREIRILMIGLDAAGKTTALYKLKLGEVVTTIPTIGFNVETLEHGGVHLTAWDIGLRNKSRPLMRHYFPNTQALLYIVDSNDKERLDEAKELLWSILDEDELRETPLLVMANKQDHPSAMTITYITEKLGLHDIRNRKWYIVPTAATTGQGLREGLDWLVGTLTDKLIKSDVKSSVQTSVTEVNEATKKVKQNAWSYGSSLIKSSSLWMKSITGCSVRQFFFLNIIIDKV